MRAYGSVGELQALPTLNHAAPLGDALNFVMECCIDNLRYIHTCTYVHIYMHVTVTGI